MIVLGFDVSSTTIGASVIEYDEINDKISFISVENFHPPETAKVGLFQSLIDTKKFIIDKIKQINPDKIVVEDIAEHFQGGASSSKTIIKLAVFNRTICLAIFENFGIMPELINVNTIRSIIRPADHKGRLMKEDIPAVIEKILNIKFPFIYNKKGKIDVKTYDLSDAIAAAIAGVLKLKENKK